MVKSVAVAGLAIAVATTGASCGGDSSNGHRGDDATGKRGFTWGVISVPSERSVRAGGVVAYCKGAARPVIRNPEVRYRGSEVYIRLRLKRPGSDEGKSLCAGVDLSVARVIVLRQPVADLTIYNSGVSPPEQVWPVDQG
jgi:hypothetical protein